MTVTNSAMLAAAPKRCAASSPDRAIRDRLNASPRPAWLSSAQPAASISSPEALSGL